MLNRFVFVYLDDILIFFKNLQEHVQHVHLDLQQLLGNHLFIKLEKNNFHVQEVYFLSFIISKGHIQMDPAKTQAVRNCPRSSSTKQVKCFLGFSNFFRKFIRNFSVIAAPLTALTRKNVKGSQWTEKVQHKSLLSRILSHIS